MKTDEELKRRIIFCLSSKMKDLTDTCQQFDTDELLILENMAQGIYLF